MKRKPRKKKSKDQSIDIMKPIPLEKIGTENDPCFGKHHEPSAPECNMCGDSELCAIAQSQKLHIKRGLIEDKQQFKDIQNTECKWHEVSKCIQDILKKKKKPMPLPIIKDKVVKELKIHESLFDNHLMIIKAKSKMLVVKGSIIKLSK